MSDSIAENGSVRFLRADLFIKLQTASTISRNIRLFLAETSIDYVFDSGNGDRRLSYISC